MWHVKSAIHPIPVARKLGVVNILHAVRDPYDVPPARKHGQLVGQRLKLVESLLYLVLLAQVHRPGMAGRFHGLIENLSHVVRPRIVVGGFRSYGMNRNQLALQVEQVEIQRIAGFQLRERFVQGLPVVQPVGLVLIHQVEQDGDGVLHRAARPVGMLQRSEGGGRAGRGLMESEDGFRLALVDDLEIGRGQVGHGLAARVERYRVEVHQDGRPRSLCQKSGSGQSDGAKESFGFQHN